MEHPSITDRPMRSLVVANSPMDAESNWHNDLAEAVRSPDELLRRLGLPTDVSLSQLEFPTRVPLSFVDRMQPGHRDDPLLLQVLPREEERHDVPGFVTDAVNDSAARRSPGLLQKYAGRALLITTGSCAVHCRYCFRREYPYGEEPRRFDEWLPAFRSLDADATIREVILSGGDPLMLTDSRLEQLCQRIADVPHVERIRIHTRLPIVLPSRVTSRLTALLTSLRPQIVFVVHANHGNEIRADCAEALKTLVTSGFPVLNQTVLLQRINDSVDALEQLSMALINVGVMPYYLHQLDRVVGTAHFEVPSDLGLQIIEELRKRLPGYAIPQYVREVPGEFSKVPVNASDDSTGRCEDRHKGTR